MAEPESAGAPVSLLAASFAPMSLAHQSTASLNAFRRQPSSLVRGRGRYLRDGSDKTRFDAVRDAAVCNLGRRHPARAVTETMRLRPNTRQ